MKKAGWMAFVLFLFFAGTTAFAQSDVSATSKQKEEEATSKVIKVDEGRKVIVSSKSQASQTQQTPAKYDEKGGLVVDNASKGVRRTTLTDAQKARLAKLRLPGEKRTVIASPQNAPQSKQEMGLQSNDRVSKKQPLNTNRSKKKKSRARSGSGD